MYDEPKLSEFNRGIAFLYQLQTCSGWVTINRVNRDYRKAYDWLLAWWDLLSPWTSKEEIDEANRYVSTLRNALNGNNDDMKLQAVRQTEVFVRRIEKKYGLLMPDKSSAHDALRG